MSWPMPAVSGEWLSSRLLKRVWSGLVSLGGFAAVGGMLIADAVGYILQWTLSYLLPFLIAGSAYLTALLILHLLFRSWGLCTRQ